MICRLTETELQKKSLKELIEIREDKIKNIRDIENGTSHWDELAKLDICVEPGADVAYQIYLEDLQTICKVIIEKCREENNLGKILNKKKRK